MSAEFSTDIERYTGPPNFLRTVPHIDVPPIAADDVVIEVPLHPDFEDSAIHFITNADNECFPVCPLIIHGLSEIVSESDATVVQSLTNWIKLIHSSCKVGPQKTSKPRFFVVGAEVVEITCGSGLSKLHPDVRTSRTVTKKS